MNRKFCESSFKENFYGYWLYSEPKEYLLELLSKHLKPINYDRWAELYWKRQLKEKLMAKEEKEFKRLEKERMEIIEGVYGAFLNDKEIIIR